MISIKFTILLLTFIAAFVTVSTQENECRALCGRQLVTALMAVCDSNYNKPIKQSSRPKRGNALGHVRGVADECCLQRCTPGTLKSYCSEDISDEEASRRLAGLC